LAVKQKKLTILTLIDSSNNLDNIVTNFIVTTFFVFLDNFCIDSPEIPGTIPLTVT